MITIHPQRQRAGDRIPSDSQKPVTEQVQSFPAPISGWVTNENMALQRPDSAFVLDNFWPTTVAIEARGGYEARVNVAGEVATLHEYSAGGRYFATDNNAIYAFDANTAIGTTLTSVVSGLNSGDFQGIETQNDAGSFLTLVNGFDPLHLYDGTTWHAVTDVSAPHAITGVDTDKLKFAWNYRNRTWFVQKDSMNAWYLGINSVSGPATKFPLAGVFRKGGQLHSGATFSSDSGDGMDDRIIFTTDQGEIAIYSGDPAVSISLIGVYDIGAPIADDPYITVGGDVLVATVAGVIPVSGAVQKGPEQLKLVSVSRPIEREWEYWVYLQPKGWKVQKWATKGMAVFAVPSSEVPFAFVVNLETGAWTRFTEWQANALATFGGELYLANGSNVYLSDATGTDDGKPIIYRVCLAFSGLASAASFKTAKRARGTFRRGIDFTPQFSIASDYAERFPAPPSSAASLSQGGNAIWDASPWDTTPWASYGRNKGARTQWHVVRGMGHALAVQLQITSAETARPDFELVSMDLTYTMGGT
jgi:hypothetical protein